MTEAQLTATKIPVNDLLDLLAAIGNRDYYRFQELEQAFVFQHGEKVWQEVFNFRVLPALDKPVVVSTVDEPRNQQHQENSMNNGGVISAAGIGRSLVQGLTIHDTFTIIDYNQAARLIKQYTPNLEHRQALLEILQSRCQLGYSLRFSPLAGI